MSDLQMNTKPFQRLGGELVAHFTFELALLEPIQQLVGLKLLCCSFQLGLSDVSVKIGLQGGSLVSWVVWVIVKVLAESAVPIRPFLDYQSNG